MMSEVTKEEIIYREAKLRASTRNILSQLFSSKVFVVGFLIVVGIGLIALLADYIAPYSPLKFVGKPLTPPNNVYLFGTDDMGRDIFSMTIYASRISLSIGFIAAILTTLLGMSIGLISGMVGGILDALLMRSIDFLLSLPYLAVALVILAFFKPNLYIIIIVIVILSWISTAKIVRANTITVKEENFIEAAKAVGGSRLYITIRHVIPNIMHAVLSSLVLNVRGAILFEASLSFLGFGDPKFISWGMMLFFARRGAAFAAGAWWYIVPPGFMIMITVLGFTLLSVGLDEVLNPRLRTD